MPNPKYQTRLPEDKAAEVDEYAESHDISKAEAVRRLVIRGLEAPDLEEIKTDGGQVIDTLKDHHGQQLKRLEEVEERQDRAARVSTLQNVVNAVGILLIIAWFTGLVAGALALVLALAVLTAEVAVIAYSFGVGGADE